VGKRATKKKSDLVHGGTGDVSIKNEKERKIFT
jgi:hypothetical protein